MKTIQLNNQNVEIPTESKEVTFERFIELFKGLDDEVEDKLSLKSKEVTVISRLLNIPEEELFNYPISFYNEIKDSVKFLWEKPIKSDLTVLLNNKVYFIKDINSFNLRRYIDVEETVKSVLKDNSYLSQLLGLILVTDEEANDSYKGLKSIEELIKVIKQTPYTELLPLLNAFFLIRNCLMNYTELSNQMETPPVNSTTISVNNSTGSKS